MPPFGYSLDLRTNFETPLSSTTVSCLSHVRDDAQLTCIVCSAACSCLVNKPTTLSCVSHACLLLIHPRINGCFLSTNHVLLYFCLILKTCHAATCPQKSPSESFHDFLNCHTTAPHYLWARFSLKFGRLSELPQHFSHTHLLQIYSCNIGNVEGGKTNSSHSALCY